MTIAPDYRLSLSLLALSVPLLFWHLWVGVPAVLFAIFLVIQTALIRLTFTDTSLEVYRSGIQIRSFPYRDWLHWQIYFPSLPILFYFWEVNSIHFLPILFDPMQLKSCLESHITLPPSPSSSYDQADGLNINTRSQ